MAYAGSPRGARRCASALSQPLRRALPVLRPAVHHLLKNPSVWWDATREGLRTSFVLNVRLASRVCYLLTSPATHHESPRHYLPPGDSAVRMPQVAKTGRKEGEMGGRQVKPVGDSGRL